VSVTVNPRLSLKTTPEVKYLMHVNEKLCRDLRANHSLNSQFYSSITISLGHLVLGPNLG